MPPSTGVSQTMSAGSRPLWGPASREVSTLMPSAGRGRAQLLQHRVLVGGQFVAGFGLLGSNSTHAPRGAGGIWWRVGSLYLVMSALVARVQAPLTHPPRRQTMAGPVPIVPTRF